MQILEAKTPQMRRVIDFAFWSIMAALLGTGFWTAVLAGIAGSLIAAMTEHSHNG
jgi:hypothetical protein